MELHNNKELSQYTPTELLKTINDTKTEHEKVKDEIIADTHRLDEVEKSLNSKIDLLTELEKKYVLLIEEMENR
jgi:septal ring factor EnvC (AmiA/AmiB activator)